MCARWHGNWHGMVEAPDVRQLVLDLVLVLVLYDEHSDPTIRQLVLVLVLDEHSAILRSVS